MKLIQYTSSHHFSYRLYEINLNPLPEKDISIKREARVLTLKNRQGQKVVAALDSIGVKVLDLSKLYEGRRNTSYFFIETCQVSYEKVNL